MAVNVIQNKKGATAVVLAIANTTIHLSDLATSNTETVNSMSITKLFFSTQNVITVACGNTTISLTNSDYWPMDYLNTVLAQTTVANVVITILDTSSTLLMELSKQSSYVSDYLGATSTS